MKIFCALALLCSSYAFAQTLPPAGVFRITIPTGVGPESVHISYNLTGSFGGYGGIVRPQARNVYEIRTALDGKFGTHIKGYLYMPGCELFMWDASLETSRGLHLKAPCKPRSLVTLKGRVRGYAVKDNSEVVIYYMANWGHSFYGITDGPVDMIEVARVKMDNSGAFAAAVPDLFDDPSARKWETRQPWSRGMFKFVIRDKHTWNILAWLHPSDGAAGSFGDLILKPSYPSEVVFVAKDKP
jgi:hypothetical protein